MDKETLERRELWERSQIKNYINGRFKINQYTEEELLEKRKYFENQLPNPSSGFPKRRWLYEIKRHFELSDDFKKYPDAGLARLEFLLKYGY